MQQYHTISVKYSGTIYHKILAKFSPKIIRENVNQFPKKIQNYLRADHQELISLKIWLSMYTSEPDKRSSKLAIGLLTFANNFIGKKARYQNLKNTSGRKKCVQVIAALHSTAVLKRKPVEPKNRSESKSCKMRFRAEYFPSSAWLVHFICIISD